MELKMYRGKWAAVWYKDGAIQRRSMGTADRALAEPAFDRFKRALTGRASTVGQAVKAYGDAELDAGKERASYAAERILERPLAQLGLDDVTEDACKAYAAERRAMGVADGTIIKELGVARAATNKTKPANGSKFWLPDPPSPKDVRLTREEFERLVAGARSEHIRIFMRLAIATGGRKTAILELTWKQLDFEHNLIDLGRGTGNKGRAIVPMGVKVRAELEALRDRIKPKPNDRVLMYAGRPIGDPKKAFERAAIRAGLPEATPHVLRHSAATWLAEANRPMGEIARYLGHASIRTTEAVYAKFRPGYMREAIDILDGQYSPVQVELPPDQTLPSIPE